MVSDSEHRARTPNVRESKKRILVVEDEAAFRDVLAAELVKENYEVISAVDGEEGLEKMRSLKPDLVLLDIMMPKKDGFAVLQEINADEHLMRIPVIVLSNSGDMVDLSRARAIGVKDVLIKTAFGPQELLARVAKRLSDSQSPEATSAPSETSTVSGDPEPSSAQSGMNPSRGNILLVEDDPFLWTLIQSKLLKEGFEVTLARDGQACLSQVNKIKPSLILLDIILPDMDGFEVLRQIKADPATASIPVIVLSNLGQQEDIARGVALGAKDYLIKAHHAPQEIVDKIKLILSSQ